ncbi:MAG TPA: alpha/beta hydrolase domain-containing protein [Candidatus Acidoferrales bacterium]|nr:alpha/beta hydrolase domain-containing protein [Candidatus Acidoferrales bacterium]
MNRLVRLATLSLLAVLVLPALSRAEVSRIEITSRRDLAEGRSFGSTGAYERLAGKIYFVIDPANARNQVIADLDKASRNAAGKVELSADIVILKPRDPSRGNGIALFDIVNRGRGVALSHFDGPATKAPDGEVGDGFLLNRGYTIVQVGWEFDARREGAIRIDLPAAVGVTGLVRAEFIPDKPNNEGTFADLAGYTPSDPASPQNTLRVREKLGTPWVTIPRAKWQLAGNTVTLEGGFNPGQTYELAYLATNPPVAGLGFAAVRDAASWMKYAPDATVSAKYAFAFGVSQTGRFLRELLYEGFYADEHGRQVFDGVIPHLGGAGGVELDQRWATPTSLLMDSATHFPFADRKLRDPVTGLEEGLLENPRASEHQPKIFYTYTATEYWERSVALTHTTPDGSKDIEPPENVRLYYLAGAPHNIASFPPAITNGQMLANPFDPNLPLRALLIAMEKWVENGATPPPSRYPRLHDHTLVRATDLAFPKIPGVVPPGMALAGVRGANRLLAKDGAGTPLPYLVPQVDRDGNDVAGLRLPDISVPLATYTGWNFRNNAIGGTEQLFPLLGGYVPLARTKAEREQAHDPRLSIEERYRSRDDYLKRVQDAANSLAKDGYLLQEDVAEIVKHAGEHWNFLIERSTSTNAR